MRKTIYVAGPLSCGDRQENVMVACRAGLELLRAGYAPLIPHLTNYLDPNDEAGYDTWVDTGVAWARRADAVLRLPGASKGADAEVEAAMGAGVRVYWSLEVLKREMPAR